MSKVEWVVQSYWHRFAIKRCSVVFLYGYAREDGRWMIKTADLDELISGTAPDLASAKRECTKAARQILREALESLGEKE